MNLRRQRPSDSLDMLLDTMCNTFGGIILLAVLVTLLTSQERRGVGTASDTPEMLQRRLALAQENLQQALQLQTTLLTKANDSRWKTQMDLLATRQQIQDEIQATRELAARDARELETAASADPAERMQELNAQLAAAQAKKTTAQNSLTAARENLSRLTTRRADLEKQATNLVAESQRELRLPREHETSKHVLYVIVRYGRVYACRTADLSKNETDIEWTSTLTTDTAEPKPGLGWDPVRNAAVLRSYFGSLTENSVYIAFCVYEDSFPAYMRARQAAVQAGLAYGWDPFRIADGPVVFSAMGHTPKPQ
ncbi:MAG TPA: hypothetical protein VL527_13800 [Dongiaceae bacterium]|nr:hypothetical protein [Dongiaceae bacterium]